MTFRKFNDKGILYDASISVPDSPIGYVVEVLVSYDGRLTMKP